MTGGSKNFCREFTRMVANFFKSDCLPSAGFLENAFLQVCEGRIPWILPLGLTPASLSLGQDDRGYIISLQQR
jgi:hypothetical protein